MFFVALFAIFIFTVGSLALPNEIKACKLIDNDCLIFTANYILQNNFQGYPQIGLDSVDPLKISSMTVDQTSGGPVNILARLANAEIVGFSKAKIYEISGFDKNLMTIKMKMPSATLLGPYEINGNILILPVNGNGKMNLNFKNFDIKMDFPLTSVKRNGKTFYQIEKPKMTFDISSGNVHLSHLGSFANGFLNYNFNTVINAIKPAISTSLIEKFADKINSVFSKMSFDELFSP